MLVRLPVERLDQPPRMRAWVYSRSVSRATSRRSDATAASTSAVKGIQFLTRMASGNPVISHRLTQHRHDSFLQMLGVLDLGLAVTRRNRLRRNHKNKRVSDCSIAWRIASGNTSPSPIPCVSIQTLLPRASRSAARACTKSPSRREYEKNTSGKGRSNQRRQRSNLRPIAPIGSAPPRSYSRPRHGASRTTVTIRARSRIRYSGSTSPRHRSRYWHHLSGHLLLRTTRGRSLKSGEVDEVGWRCEPRPEP